MKFKKDDALTRGKIQMWFKDSFFSHDHKIVHMYKHDVFSYDVLMIDKKFGTPFVIYINTLTEYATKQMLSTVLVHKAQCINDIVFKEV